MGFSRRRPKGQHVESDRPQGGHRLCRFTLHAECWLATKASLFVTTTLQRGSCVCVCTTLMAKSYLISFLFQPDLLLMLGPTKSMSSTRANVPAMRSTWARPQLVSSAGTGTSSLNMLHVVASIAPRRRQRMPFLVSGTTTTQGTEPTSQRSFLWSDLDPRCCSTRNIFELAFWYFRCMDDTCFHVFMSQVMP